MAKFSMLQTASVLLSFEYVSGHGYTTDPPARQYCAKTPVPGFKGTKGCKQVGSIQWEPQSNGNGAVAGNPKQKVPTKICGAGKYSGPDHVPASDWKATKISRNAKGGFTFKYHCTACHTTSTWEVYQTTAGWTGEQALRWSDLKSFCKIDENGAKPAKNSSYDCPFPQPTGNPRDMIVVLWDRMRGDSGEMFFSCSDVEFGEDDVTQPQPKPQPQPVQPQPQPGENKKPKRGRRDVSEQEEPEVDGEEVTQPQPKPQPQPQPQPQPVQPQPQPVQPQPQPGENKKPKRGNRKRREVSEQEEPEVDGGEVIQPQPVQPVQPVQPQPVQPQPVQPQPQPQPAITTPKPAPKPVPGPLPVPTINSGNGNCSRWCDGGDDTPNTHCKAIIDPNVIEYCENHVYTRMCKKTCCSKWCQR